jgi:hypothetical protein
MCCLTHSFFILFFLDRIRGVWEAYYAPKGPCSDQSTTSNGPHSESNSDDDLDREIYGNKRRHLDTAENELSHYLNTAVIDGKIDMLNWWRLQEQVQYPNLAQMARNYLSIPASSAATERTFSSAGNLISENRSCLSPEIVQILMCMRSWRKSGLIT